MTAVVSTLIELDERGVAWITGTKVKVIEVATDKLAHGSSPEEMYLQYPHLSLAQMYAVLAYYYEHQAKFDEEILRPLPIRDLHVDMLYHGDLRHADDLPMPVSSVRYLPCVAAILL